MFHKYIRQKKGSALDPFKIANALDKTHQFLNNFGFNGADGSDEITRVRVQRRVEKEDEYYIQASEMMIKKCASSSHFLSDYAILTAQSGRRFITHQNHQKEDYQSQRSVILRQMGHFFAITFCSLSLERLVNSNYSLITERGDKASFKQTHLSSKILQLFTSKLNQTLFNKAEIDTYNETKQELELIYQILESYVNQDSYQFTDSLKYLKQLEKPAAKGFYFENRLIYYIKCIFHKSMLTVMNQILDLNLKIRRDHGGFEKMVPVMLPKLHLLLNLHFVIWTFDYFHEMVILEKDESVKRVLQKMCTLYGINEIISNKDVGRQVMAMVPPDELIDLIQEKEMIQSCLDDKIMKIVEGIQMFQKWRNGFNSINQTRNLEGFVQQLSTNKNYKNKEINSCYPKL